MEQEFERWLALARQWAQANLTVILLCVVAVAIIVAAVAFRADTKEKTRASVLADIDRADMELRDLFGQTDPGSVACAEVFMDSWITGEWQKTSGRGYFPALDDHRSVVGGVGVLGIKKAEQELIRNTSIDLYPFLSII